MVTGSARGLGFFIAKALGGAGAIVMLNGTNKESLEKKVDELRDRVIKCFFSAFDISDS